MRWLKLGGALGALAIIALGMWHYGNLRVAKIQAEWNADKLAWEAANEKVKSDADAQIKAADDARAAAVKNRDEAIAAIDADRTSLGGMLRSAQDRLRGCTAAEATSARGLDVARAIASSAAETLGRIEQRYDEYDRACRIDAADKTALQEIIRPVADIN